MHYAVFLYWGFHESEVCYSALVLSSKIILYISHCYFVVIRFSQDFHNVSILV